MSDHDHKSCPLCAATKRVFGERRFGGCAGIANEMAEDAVKLIKAKTEELLAELAQKREAGLVSNQDFDVLESSIKHSFPFAASNVPAVALISGAKSSPPDMMQLVQANMVHLVQAVFQRKLEAEGPGGIIELLMALRNAGAEPGSSDPNMN